MAAEQLAKQQIPVTVYDAMPSVGRKFLRAGIGGLNLTHSEDKPAFINRYQPREAVAPWLDVFDSEDLVQWARELGVETFVGSSGRVFPTQKKAAPLLRAWLKRLKESGVTIETRHRWLGWNDQGDLRIQSPVEELTVRSKVVIFALGGGSWARLGSDGHWLSVFKKHGIDCQTFRPSNCGFNYPWSDAFQQEQGGQPLKGVVLTCGEHTKKGDATLSHYGVEGSLIYGLSAPIRDAIELAGEALVHWDLLPDLSLDEIRAKLKKRRAKDSLSNVLRKQLSLSGGKLALLKALITKEQMQDLETLPALLKHLPQRLQSCRPIDEAISTAGGITMDSLNDELMIKAMPGTFCIGEMLDWDAPTGGYLLTACYASGVVAGKGAVDYLQNASSGTENIL